MAVPSTTYSADPAWADITPIAQIDGGPDALAEIAYTAEYSEAMSYLRALMAKAEKSERALGLTEHLIGLNPAHYTVWSYRSSIVAAIDRDAKTELEWVNSIALQYQKNYQIWGYRQNLMEQIRQPDGEQAFIDQMLELDSKNYHVWTYRQWLVSTFAFWPRATQTADPDRLAGSQAELRAVDRLIEKDVRNNSAWNHRWFLLFGHPVDPEIGLADPWADEQFIDEEQLYAISKISLAHQNESAWNYLRGLIIRRIEKWPTYLTAAVSTIFSLAMSRTSPAISPASLLIPTSEMVGETRSTYSVDILAELVVMQASGKYPVQDQSSGVDERQVKLQRYAAAVSLLDLLSDSLDCLRRPYWALRRAEIWKAVGDGGVLERDWNERRSQLA